MRYNVSTGKPYHTQRDNPTRPSGTCGPTSLAMALIYSKVQLPPLPDEVVDPRLPPPSIVDEDASVPGIAEDGTVIRTMQLEEYITRFLAEDHRVQDYYRTNFKSLYEEGVPANEVHAVAAMGINLWLGRPVFRFTVEASMKDVIFRIAAGIAVPMSGVWAGFRHIVCVVGCDTAQDLSLVKSPAEVQLPMVSNIIVDDPYGNYATKYKDPKGNDIVVPFGDFVDITRTQGTVNHKWAYLIS